jgi:hypothetical protein
MVVTSIGVTSAEVKLNDDVIFGPDAFDGKSHDTPIVQSRQTFVQTGTNVLDVSYSLRGSPGDSLKVQLFSCDEPPVLYYERTFIRIPGRPTGGSDTVDIP